MVEDEPLARDVLRRLIAGEPDMLLVAECVDGTMALETIRTERPDLLFLDIRLPGLSGLELLETLAHDAPPAVIFATASDRHAVRAFSSHAVDYLLKPFTRERFRAALDKARARLHSRTRLSEVAARAPRSATPASLSLKVARGFVVLRFEEIESLTAGRAGSAVNTSIASHRTRQTLAVLQNKLPPEKFLRINRSTLINTEHIMEIIRKGHGDGRVRLRSGREFPLARRWRAQWATLLAEG